MAPRAYWKGYLKLSPVSFPIALFPATSEREKIGFHQLHKKTGNRIKYRKIDADTGDEVEAQNIIKDDYLELDPEELEAVALDSTRTIEIDALRCPYEVRKEEDYFGDLLDQNVSKDMLDLPKHIVATKVDILSPSSRTITSRH